MLLSMNVLKFYWYESVLTACFLINRMPTKVLKGEIPFNSFFPPNSPLFFVSPSVFNCVCFVHKLWPLGDKMDPKAVKCIFLRYSRNQKCYKYYSPHLHKKFMNVDITFHESLIFYHTMLEISRRSFQRYCQCSSSLTRMFRRSATSREEKFRS